MPQSIPAGITRDHVLRTLGDLDAGINHPFGQPTGYVLVHEGHRYAPKAVIGLAYRYSLGRMLLPEEFSGGEAPGQANYVLRHLGFSVIKKEEAAEPDPDQSRQPWSDVEVDAIVADYFQMLRAELQGQPYSKSEHRQTLAPKLPTRSKGSIEFKHQNISAVLVELGLPYIEGYKPRGNYQSLLAESVESFVDRHPTIITDLSAAPLVQPPATLPPTPSKPDDVVEAPPERTTTPRSREKPWLTRRARRIDFAELDAANRKLGRYGEQFVVDFERRRLMGLGRDDLAQKVEWVSQDIGDGLGYDVRSFDDADDSDRYLEVKTTGLGKYFPFYVSINEIRCSEDVPQKYHLYRVFDFSRSPRLYILHGALSSLCQLDPIQFRATIGGQNAL